VVIQADELALSTVLIAPTSQSAPPRIFRPAISIAGERTHVLVEQTTAVAPERLGAVVGHVSRAEMDDINSAATPRPGTRLSGAG